MATRVFAWDIENNEDNSKILVGLSGDGENVIQFWGIPSFIEYLRREIPGGIFWSHGDYDIKFLLYYLRQMGEEFEIIPLNSVIKELKWGKYRFRNSLILFANLPLRKLGDWVGLPKLDPGDNFLNLEYNAQDVRILYKALERFSDFMGVDLGKLPGTAGSAALRYFELDTHELRIKMDRIAEPYYSGGRVEVFRNFLPIAYGFDRNSSYPASMRSIPWVMGGDVIWVEAEVENIHHIPVYPIRVGHGIFYPLGVVRVLDRLSALERFEALGAIRILRVLNVWRVEERKIDMHRLYRKRKENPEISLAIKTLMNSAYGIMAYKGNIIRIKVHKQGEIEILRYKRIPRWRSFFIAHAITQDARHALWHALNSSRNPAYCDTDSVYSEEIDQKLIGDELGQWGLEKVLDPGVFMAKKLYGTIERPVKSKGIKNPGVWKLGEKYTFESASTFREVLDGKPPGFVERSREIIRPYMGRRIVGDTTEPWETEDIHDYIKLFSENYGPWLQWWKRLGVKLDST